MSAAATSLGSMLRQERLRRQLDLAGIAKETKICTPILDAIENDRFNAIPGGAYRRYFVGQYGRALGMDPDAVVAKFKEQFEEPPLPLPTPPKTRRSPLWADLACAVVVLASLTAAYQVGERMRAATKHQQTAALSAPPVRPSAERQAEPAAPPAAAAAPPSAVAPPAPAAPIHVSFTALEPVWVSVKCDGNASYMGMLEVTQNRTFDASAAVTALIGNAGGVQISLNGKPVGALGAHGEVEMIEVTGSGARRIARHVGAADANTVPQL